MLHNRFIYNDLSNFTNDTLFKNGQIINFKYKNVKKKEKKT